MVVNKLQRGVSWGSYTCPLGSNTNGEWTLGDGSGGNDGVNMSESLIEWVSTFPLILVLYVIAPL